jgi:hypothetical protein
MIRRYRLRAKTSSVAGKVNEVVVQPDIHALSLEGLSRKGRKETGSDQKERKSQGQ